MFPGNNLIYILTWQEHRILRFENRNGKIIEKDRLVWRKEGWGLTHNSINLIISDGSHLLYVANENLEVLRVI